MDPGSLAIKLFIMILYLIEIINYAKVLPPGFIPFNSITKQISLMLL